MPSEDQESLQLELIQRCVDQLATDAELAQLEERLLHEPAFRKRYIDYLAIDSALASGIAKVENSSTSSKKSSRRLSQIPHWNPILTAVAGLVIGLFFASMAWAFINPRGASSSRIEMRAFFEDFEPKMTSSPIVNGFPTQTGAWGGDPAKIITTDSTAVLGLQSSTESNLGYIQRIFEVAHLPQAGKNQKRNLEISASFFTEPSPNANRYTVRVATFKESPEEIRNLWENYSWRELDRNTLTMIKAGHTTTPDTNGWQMVSAVASLPADAKYVVVSLAAGRRMIDAPKATHYLDNIEIDLVIEPLSKRELRLLKQLKRAQ